MTFKVSTGFPCHTSIIDAYMLFMFDVIKHNVPDDLASLFTLKSGSRPSRRGSQCVIPRVKYEIGKQSIQYRGPTLWTFLNRLI